MITIITTSKGGEGKSTISTLLPLLAKNENFEIIEIDNNNNSNFTYQDSMILKNKLRTIKVKDADDFLDNVFFEALKADEKHTIIVSGGGDDSVKLLELLAEQPGQNIIKFIIPLTAAGDFTNILETYNLIENKDNIMFCLNGYHLMDKVEDEFFNFYGDKKLGFEGVIDSIENPKVLKIPFSKYFSIAKRYRLSLIDLANFSMDLSPDDAYVLFDEQSKGDPVEYAKMYKRYRASRGAAKVIKEIENNLKNM